MKYLVALAILLLGIVVILFTSCTKEYSIAKPVECANCVLISEKYTEEEVYLYTDTLWHDMLCGRWLDTIRAQKPAQYKLCGNFMKEKRYYVIINQ